MKKLGKEVKDVYTGYLVKLTLTLPNTADITFGIRPLLLSLQKACINTKIYSYVVMPSNSGIVLQFMFFVCPANLDRLDKLFGYGYRDSGTLNEYPGLENLSVYYTTTSDVAVQIVIREAVVINTKCFPTPRLRTSLLEYIVGAGFTVTSFSILGNSIVVDSVARDIKSDNNAKLMIGSMLPVLGNSKDCHCEELCQGKKRCESSSSDECRRRRRKKSCSSEELRYKRRERYRCASSEELRQRRW